MALCGYAGNILHVDLSSGRTREEALPEERAKKFIDGRSLNHQLARDLLRLDAGPFSPENLIIVGAGPFSGTLVPGCSELAVSTKFPINGAFATAAGGGRFALMQKTCGYDHLVISGRSKNPVYLKITDAGAELCDARDLWGKDSLETTDELWQRHDPCSVIPVGQAGENLVKISVAFIDYVGTIGSGGLPAVMGSKNLKAIVAVEGTHAIQVADRQRFLKIVQELLDRMTSWAGRGAVLETGFSGEVSSSQYAAFPSDNFSRINFGEFTPEEREQMLSIHRSSAKMLACPSCVMADKDRIRVRDAGQTGPVKYASGMLFKRFGQKDLNEAYRLTVEYENELNRYGLCSTNFDPLVSFILHLYERGIVTREDVGMELRDDFETRMTLAGMTASRKGFGDVLAEGILGACRRLGKDIERHAVHIKGRAPHVDPRVTGMGTMPLTQITDPRGAFPAGGAGPATSRERHLPSLRGTASGWASRLRRSAGSCARIRGASAALRATVRTGCRFGTASGCACGRP